MRLRTASLALAVAASIGCATSAVSAVSAASAAPAASQAPAAAAAKSAGLLKVSDRHVDQCLDSDKDGGVYTHNCHENLANPNMQWRVTVKKKDEGPTGGDRFERSDDWIQIQNVKSGRCLADNGADIVTQACDANDAWQYFNFAQATATKDPSFYVTTGHGFASMTYRNNPDDEITRQESDGVSFWEVLDPATGKMINGLEGSRS